MADTKPELEISINSVIKTAKDCGMVFEQLSDGYYLTEKTTAGDVIQFAMRISNAAARRADAAPSEIARLRRIEKAAHALYFEAEEYDLYDGLGLGIKTRQSLWDALGSCLEEVEPSQPEGNDNG